MNCKYALDCYRVDVVSVAVSGFLWYTAHLPHCPLVFYSAMFQQAELMCARTRVAVIKINKITFSCGTAQRAASVKQYHNTHMPKCQPLQWSKYVLKKSIIKNMR